MEHNTRYELQEAQARSAVYRLRDGFDYERRMRDEIVSAAEAAGQDVRDWMRARLADAANDWLVAWMQTGVGQSSMWYHAKFERWDYFNG